MQFISIYFYIAIFFILIGYYVTPGKLRYLFLLACNALFYMSWITDFKGCFSIIFVTLITWVGAFLIQKTSETKYCKLLMQITVALTAGTLFYFKYIDFFIDNINAIFPILDIEVHIKTRNPLMPIGISFITFQALSYVLDIYKGRFSTEKNILLYATYISFFPTVLSGPIERPTNLLKQLEKIDSIKFRLHNVRNGLFLVLWGGWIKYVIADRFAIIVGTVFDAYDSYGSVMLCFAMVCYTLQIYCDFLSYSVIALGLGKMLGINLMENFNAPYFAISIQEFWRRWHISLSTWFRDYIYIPLGGSRCSVVRKNANLFVTFLVSGLWHGADWTFIIWGMMHGMYQIVGNITAPFKKRLYRNLRIKQDCFSFRLGQRICTFALVSYAWIFFRADSLNIAIDYSIRMITKFDIWNLFNNSIYNLGLDILQMNILLISFSILMFVDYFKYKTGKNVDVLLFEQNYIFYLVIVILVCINTLIFGMYGPTYNSQDFIYFQF